MVEVKLDSIKNAADIRKAYAEKKKDKVDLGRIFIANSVTLATRVRVNILKAIARKLSNKDTSAHAVPFISRPEVDQTSEDSVGLTCIHHKIVSTV
jgi:hypothetical protein